MAVGLYFDWSSSDDIPVLAVFHAEPLWRLSDPLGLAGYSLTPVDQVWTDYYGVTGTGMQTAPFPGQFPAFSGFAYVPEPASLLLIGSGLAGLAGMKRRKN